MTREQLIHAQHHAEKFAESVAALLVLDDVGDSKFDAKSLRVLHNKSLKFHIEGLAAECGYRLVPVEREREAA